MQNNSYPSVSKANMEPTFFGKVMGFFALAVLISAAATFITIKYWLGYFIATPALMFGLFIVELIIILTSRLWSTKIPLNRLMFAAFAFITGMTLAPLIGILAASPAGMAIIFKALLVTGIMFAATAIFGWTTQLNLSGMRFFLMSGLIGMIVVGIIGFFIPWGSTMEIVYSAIGVILFNGFIAYDFQKIKQYPADRYIDAALNLYLDIFNLFLYILRLLSALNRR